MHSGSQLDNLTCQLNIPSNLATAQRSHEHLPITASSLQMSHFTKINLNHCHKKNSFPGPRRSALGNQILLINYLPLRSTQLGKISVKFCLFSAEATGIFWVVELRKWLLEACTKNFRHLRSAEPIAEPCYWLTRCPFQLPIRSQAPSTTPYEKRDDLVLARRYCRGVRVEPWVV